MFIYTITNVHIGKVYVGQTKNGKLRWMQHTSLLNRQKHPNEFLQNAWNKDGIDSFEFAFVASARHDLELNELEQVFIDTLQSNNREFGYNLSTVLGGIKTHSPETRHKLSVANKGKTLSEEHRRKISLAGTGKRGNNTGKRHSEETRKKMSEAAKRRMKRNAQLKVS